jgi:E3 ubiquitin-protein ligase MUL1
MRVLQLLNGLGAASCAIAGVLAAVGLAKGRQARALQGVVYVENLSELKHLLSAVPLLIAVVGRVLAPKPLKCELSSGEGAIVELREDKKSERLATSVWVADSSPLRKVVREAEWALGGEGGEVPVVDGRRATGDYLQTSGDVFLPAQEGVVEQVLGQLAGHKTLGVRRSERFLPVGTVLTAVGEAYLSVDHPGAFKGAPRVGGRMLVLGAPQKGPFLLSRQRLPDMIASAQAGSRLCGVLAAWFGGIGAGMLAVSASHRVWVWHRERTTRRRVRDVVEQRARAAAAARRSDGGRSSAAGGAAGGREGDKEARSLCVVCLERPCELIFPACGHLCVCAACGARDAALARCPICRSSGRPIRVFVT